MEDGYTRVAAAGDVPPGEMIAVMAGKVQVALANVGGEFYCVENMCSHEDAQLHYGYVLADICQVECPMHEGRFDLKTGAATQSPAEYPLKTYSVRVEGDDIYVGPKKA